MSIISAVKSAVSVKEPKLTTRLFKGGFEKMGHVKREADTRTQEQLLENIDYFSNISPDVAQFKDDLKSMRPQHLGLVSDICELAQHHEFLNTAIDIKKPASDGKSLFRFLLEKLPKASKENPASVELAQEIINNTDSIAAKYTLGSLSGIYDCKDAAAHMKSILPLVGEIAENELKGGYTMDYTKEQNFVKGLLNMISPSVIIEKLNILPEIIKVADNSKAMCQIDAFPFLTNKTSIQKIRENLDVFQKIDSNMDGKTINLTDFLENNVNLR